MAAGGSAPELATSLIGTFRQSEIGFGTIVGSAVFNILFVIGMCSILAKEVLTLTWWPLFRDTSYYTLGLVMLAVFTGFVTPNMISLWEACVLFAMYIGYILLMWQNKNLYKAITGKVLEYPDEDEENDTEVVIEAAASLAHTSHANSNSNGNSKDEDNKEKPTEDTSESASTSKDGGGDGGDGGDGGSGGMRGALKKELSKSSIHSQVSLLSGKSGDHSQPHFRWQGTFRAGILKLLKDGDSWMDTAGAGIVSKIIGDADYVFEQVDKDGNGHIDKDELRQLFNLLECYASAEELDEVFVQLDTNGDGVVSGSVCLFLFLFGSLMTLYMVVQLTPSSSSYQ
jgi:sodium/potassium/calcium exchanger 2